MLGWKVGGERTGNTSGGLTSDGFCRVRFDRQQVLDLVRSNPEREWNLMMSHMVVESGPVADLSGSDGMLRVEGAGGCGVRCNGVYLGVSLAWATTLSRGLSRGFLPTNAFESVSSGNCYVFLTRKVS